MTKDTEVTVNINSGISNSENIVIGDYYLRIEDSVPENSRQKLRDETLTIVNRISYSGDTGLVVGKIQSGKTASFEAVSSLARDNGTPLIIILAGISNILVDQTFNRLKKDFKHGDEARFDWNIKKTQLEDGFIDILEGDLKTWNSTTIPEANKKATVIVAMKNHVHIDNLIEIFSDSRLKKALKSSKVLIIDDEADQHSLNAKPAGDPEAPTYQKLVDLKNSFSNATFIQYTATPAGCMLLNLLDPLSADWAENVNPGKGYVAMESLFSAADSPYIKQVDDNEELEVMPDDLKLAMASFVLGVASGELRNHEGGNRSMLVHPSELTAVHTTFFKWINVEWTNWKRWLNEGEGSSYQELKDILLEAYDDLTETCTDPYYIEDFQDLLKQISNINIQIELINSGRDSTSSLIDWDDSYAFIIVSGKAVDRGTTVEGLTVTYMPRKTSFQTDTQTQRARFLGYKEKYKGFIRIWLEDESKQAYRDYYYTEDDFRELVANNSGKDFKEAPRQWRLSNGAKSCRPGVIKLQGALVVSGDKKSKWTYPRSPHLFDKEENNELIKDYLDGLTLEDWHENNIVGRTDQMKHQTALVDFKEVYRNLISGLSYPSARDETAYRSLSNYLMSMYHHSDELEIDKARIIVMGHEGKTTPLKDHGNKVLSGRRRGLTMLKDSEGNKSETDKISGFHQGAFPDTRTSTPEKPAGSIYSGDRFVFDKDLLTIQIFNFNIVKRDGTIFENVLVPAFRLSEKNRLSFDIQSEARKADIDIDTVSESNEF